MSRILEAIRRAEQANKSRLAAEAERAPNTHPVSPIQNREGQSGGAVVAVSETTSAPASRERAERRKQKRVSMKLSARIRPASFMNGTFDEVLVTINASRHSLYFTTASEHFQLGMRLHVKFPYNSASDSVTGSEDDGEVMRVERLSSKRVGVAVRLRGPAKTVVPAEGTGYKMPVRGIGERRHAKRHSFFAEVVLLDSHSGMRLDARCSDLSLGGCYIDTLNPFPEGTTAHIQMRRGERIFEGLARVNSSHVGMGMGLGFQGTAADQVSTLADWLTNENGGQVLSAAQSNKSSAAKRADSLDRAQSIEVVRKLLSDGQLTKTDLSILFSDPREV